jgi:hypothetical protein
MADSEKLCAVYHPDFVIKNKTALATFCLYFDEVQCIPFLSLYQSKTGAVEDFQIILPFPVEGDEISSFLVDNRSLENEVLFYKRDVIDMVIHGATLENEQLCDLAGILFGQRHPNMHSIVRFCVIGILAEKRGWIPIGDQSDIPIPVPQGIFSSSKTLSPPVAEECFRVLLPACLPASSEDMLEVRKNLEDELLPFRTAVQKLSNVLRKAPLPDHPSLVKLKQEARFLVETTVEPALHDLRTKIELEKGNVWRRVFGSALTWVPLIGHAFGVPSVDLVCEALETEPKDVQGPVPTEQGMRASMQLGLSFLLQVDEIRKQAGTNP